MAKKQDEQEKQEAVEVSVVRSDETGPGEATSGVKATAAVDDLPDAVQKLSLEVKRLAEIVENMVVSPKDLKESTPAISPRVAVGVADIDFNPLFWLSNNTDAKQKTQELLYNSYSTLTIIDIKQLIADWHYALKVDWNENVQGVLQNNYSQYAAIALLFFVRDQLQELFDNLLNYITIIQ